MKTQSQIFDFGRFGDCLMRDLRLNGKSWMLKALMMLGVTTLLLIFATNPYVGPLSMLDYTEKQAKGAFIIFRFCGSAFCALGASMLMENMTTKGLRLNTLMSPASNLEKYLSRFLICIVGVTVAFIICFAIADAIRVLYILQYYGEVDGLRYIGPFGVQAFAENQFFLWGFLIALQATFALGSTIWPKNSFLKTFGAIIILLIAFFLIDDQVFSAIFKKGSYVSMPGETLGTVFVTVCAIWAVFCHITAYFRFKESEIIHRF